MKYFIVLSCLLLLAGCSRDPIATRSSDNQDLRIDVLGHIDDCTIYRFMDDGRHVHFVRCGPRVTVSADYVEGKTTVNQSTQTEMVGGR